MDKSCVMNSKKIEISQKTRIHRLLFTMPEREREYGLSIINGSINCISRCQEWKGDVDRQFEFYSLSHMFGGCGRLKIGMRTWDVEPGDAILICPGDWHYYGGWNGKNYCEDAIRFCGKIPDFMRKNGLIHTGIFKFGAVRKLIPLIESSRSPAPDAWLKSALELQQLLLDMVKCNRTTPVESLLETIHNAPSEHWWSVDELAELRGISRDRLRREFIKHTGMLPKKYLEHFKLRSAAEFLISRQATVTETALHFGYVDRYHFSRRFKYVFGVSPEQYRKLFANINGDMLRH